MKMPQGLRSYQGMVLAAGIGMAGYAVQKVTGSSFADPLLIALLAGIVVGTAIGAARKSAIGLDAAWRILIPPGIALYALKHLNFVKYAKVESRIFVLLLAIMLVYFGTIFLLGRIFRQKPKTTYLIAVGSAVCGASAIAMTSSAVEAEPDDISVSLVSVSLIGLLGVFVIVPFCASLLGISNKMYGLLAASVLQFTGFVKAAVSAIPFLQEEIPADQVVSLALNVKSARYLGLLVAIPLFASLERKRLSVPWAVWVFLVAGLFGSWLSQAHARFYGDTALPFITPVYQITWSVAMAAIGLSADIKNLLSNSGIHALLMACAGFAAAIAAFFCGIHLL
jgi:uncharacterized integral membrane protein (TIGR00698 family)